MKLYMERCRFRSLRLIEFWFRALKLRILGRTPELLSVSGFRGSRRLISRRCFRCASGKPFRENPASLPVWL